MILHLKLDLVDKGVFYIYLSAVIYKNWNIHESAKNQMPQLWGNLPNACRQGWRSHRAC